MAVDPQGGRGVPVSEPLLSLENVALADQHGRDRVAQPVQGDVGMMRPLASAANQ